MSVRINLEIGHEASIRTKRTPEGFTHDWEVFVRGCDGTEIQYFVEKVVFHLHETFPKPKRVIKEPPYAVKESGYAGFNLPIEIYLRNKDEPKKIKFNYDLHLQPSGPAIIKVQKEKYIFNMVNEEFKHKLLKGGGSVVLGVQDSTEPNRSTGEIKNELINKPKLGGSDPMKKHKVKLEEPRVSNSFQDLFGTPITKTSKVSLSDVKSVPKDVNKNSTVKSEKGPVLEKDKTKEKSKYSPNKEKDKDRDKTKEKGDSERRKEDKKNKDRNREREHSKEKSSKREKSPRARSLSPKRSPKRASSPKRLTSPPPVKHKEEKRLESGKDKEKKERSSEEKGEKKSKKEKRDKDKEHKENKHKEKDSLKPGEYKEHKNKEQKPGKELAKEKEKSPSPHKNERKEKPKEKDVPKEPPKETKEIEASLEKNDKPKIEKIEEKQKHKHKKKDRERKDKEKEKSHKDKTKEKEKTTITKLPEPYKEIREEKPSLFSSPKNEDKPKKVTLFSEAENDTSNSSLSSREEVPFIESAVEKVDAKKEPFEPKKPKDPEKAKKEKSKKNKEKKGEKDDKKRKRKSDKIEEEPMEKIPKADANAKMDSSDSEQNSNPPQPTELDKENQENPEDYMQILRDLQHKIMSLQDNAELQKVVQLIAETGRYEVSARTFDFDLCLLEKSTVRQLQEFFASST